MSVGAAQDPGATAPLEKLTGSMPVALSLWAGPALMATLVWLPQLKTPCEETSARKPRLLGQVPQRQYCQAAFETGRADPRSSRRATGKGTCTHPCCHPVNYQSCNTRTLRLTGTRTGSLHDGYNQFAVTACQGDMSFSGIAQPIAS